LDKVEIQIIDPDNNILGTLLVADDDKFPLSLTKSVANLKNINERSGSYSTSFKVASTRENDELLEHLYYASEKNYKDWDADKRARIIVNGIDIDTGRLRVTRVASKKNNRDYSFTFFGDNMDWVLLMQDKYFNDLPYLDQSFTWNDTLVSNSWTNTAGNNNPVFSLINRGNRILPDMTMTSDFYPDYFTYDVIKDAFNLIGYNLNAPFIEEDKFKKLITPFFGSRFKAEESVVQEDEAFVRLEDEVLNFDTSFTGASVNILRYNTYLDSSYSNPSGSTYFNGTDTGTNVSGYDETDPYFDTNSNFTTFYTAPDNGYYNFELDVSATMTLDSSSTGYIDKMEYQLYSQTGAATPVFRGTLIYDSGTGLTSVTTASGVTATMSGIYYAYYGYLDAGDKILLRSYVRAQGLQVNETYDVTLTHHNSTTLRVKRNQTLVEGNVFNWKEVSDNEVSLLKYITDLGKIFNWYFRTDTTTRTVYIETRDNFNNELSSAINWTDKINDNRQYELFYNSKFYRQLQKFKYSDDSDDKLLEWWDDKTGLSMQNLTHEYPEKFKTGSTKLELDVIAPTITAGDSFTGGNNPVVSFMWSKEPDAGIPELKLNYKPRLLYYNYSTQQDIDGTPKSFFFNNESTARTTIPYCLPFKRVVNNVILADVENSLDFNDLVSYYSSGAVLDSSVTADGLYTQYYQKTCREIQEGRSLNIDLDIDLIDYRNIDFKTPLYFDNRYPDIEGYWRIDKIGNFKVLGGRSTKFSLIQAKNFQPLPYNSNTGDVFTDTSEATDGFRKGNQVRQDISLGKAEVLGYKNIVSPDTAVAGFGLESSLPNQVRLGAHNVDVSTDIFQLGTGIDGDPYSLIRVDVNGNILFNGELIKGDLADALTIVTKTANFTASNLTSTYLCDTSSNDIEVKFPSEIKIGKTWNIKKTSENNKVVIIGVTDDETDKEIIYLNDNAHIQHIGDGNFIII